MKEKILTHLMSKFTNKTWYERLFNVLNKINLALVIIAVLYALGAALVFIFTEDLIIGLAIAVGGTLASILVGMLIKAILNSLVYIIKGEE